MSLSDRLKKLKIQPVEFPVPSWDNEPVFLLPLSVDERKEYKDISAELELQMREKTLTQQEYIQKMDDLALAIVVKKLVDKKGNQEFEDHKKFQAAIKDLPYDGVPEIFDAIMFKDIRTSGKIKDAEKNSRPRRR